MVCCGMIYDKIQYDTIYTMLTVFQSIPSNPWEFQLSFLKLDTACFFYGHVLSTFLYEQNVYVLRNMLIFTIQFSDTKMQSF